MLEGLPYLQLKHGLMEFEYTANYNPVQTPQFSHLLDSQEPDHLDFEISSQTTAAGVMQDEDFGVAMTASMDPSGHLLLGMVHTKVGGRGIRNRTKPLWVSILVLKLIIMVIKKIKYPIYITGCQNSNTRNNHSSEFFEKNQISA